jgi:hypothetical protein
MQATIVNKQANVGQKVSHSPTVEVCLSRDELFTMSGDRRGTQLKNVDGVVWVTQSGDPEDHCLQPGETFVISHKGKVVVTGLPSATVRVA